MSKLDQFLAEREVKEGGVQTPPAQPAAPAPGEGEPVAVEPDVTAPADPVATPAEPVAPAEPAAEPAAQAPAFDINSFNTFFETSLKEEAELREALKNATEYGELKRKLDERETASKALEDKNKELTASLNPLNYFSSPDAYVAEQIRIQRPDVDPGVVSKLLSNDKQRLADFDLLVYDHLYQVPDTIGGVDGARKVLAKKYEVDLEESADTWDVVSRNQILADARMAERRVAQLKSEIRLPEVPSSEAIETQRAEAVEKMKASWAPYVQEISKFEKLVIPGENGTTLLEMEIPKAFRDTLPEYINGIIEQTGLEATPENMKEVVDYRNRTFVYDNLPKILEVYGNNIRSAMEKEKHDLLNNTVPPNTAVAPPPIGSEKNAGARAFLNESTKRRW